MKRSLDWFNPAGQTFIAVSCNPKVIRVLERQVVPIPSYLSEMRSFISSSIPEIFE